MIQPAGFDIDDDFIGFRFWVWPLDDLQDFRSAVFF
jgi:hypothetical protein